MRFIQDTTMWIRPDRSEEFQSWYIANRERLAADYVEGTSLLGVFYTVFGRNEGQIHMLEFLDSYAALDRVAEQGRRAESRALQEELGAFVDFSRGFPRTSLLKDLADLTVVNIGGEAESGAAPL